MTSEQKAKIVEKYKTKFEVDDDFVRTYIAYQNAVEMHLSSRKAKAKAGDKLEHWEYCMEFVFSMGGSIGDLTPKDVITMRKKAGEKYRQASRLETLNKRALDDRKRELLIATKVRQSGIRNDPSKLLEI